ncbi:MAG: T9SS type A sorting domain-containing protein, partial [Saprospiraceae bacterium]
ALVFNGIVTEADGTTYANIAGGTPPYSYLWSNGDMTDTTTYASGDTASVVVTDAAGCTIAGSGDRLPCTDALILYNDFADFFEGAPCDDGSGCPLNEIQEFEVFAAESYIIRDFQAGGTYTFGICNGPGAGSFATELTVIDTFGNVIANVLDTCSITFTAPVAGDYIFIINEVNQCGGGPNTATNNGYPSITCEGGAEVACSVFSCDPGTLLTTDTVSVCGTMDSFTITFATNDTIPVGGSRGLLFSTINGTGGNPDGFSIAAPAASSTFDSDLNGILSFNEIDRLEGIWSIRGIVRDPSGAICGATADSLTVQFSPDLVIDDVTAGTGDGTATVTASGGTAPYTYLWSNGDTGSSADGFSDETATVTVTDSYGCTAVDSVQVPVGVGEISGLTSLMLTPNPTRNVARLSFELPAAESIRVDIIDLQGRLVMRHVSDAVTSYRHDFDLTSAPAGVYLVRIVAGRDELTRRLVVSK